MNCPTPDKKAYPDKITAANTAGWMRSHTELPIQGYYECPSKLHWHLSRQSTTGVPHPESSKQEKD